MKYFWRLYYLFRKPRSKTEAMYMVGRTHGMKVTVIKTDLGGKFYDLRGEAGGYLVPKEEE